VPLVINVKGVWVVILGCQTCLGRFRLVKARDWRTIEVDAWWGRGGIQSESKEY